MYKEKKEEKGRPLISLKKGLVLGARTKIGWD